MVEQPWDDVERRAERVVEDARIQDLDAERANKERVHGQAERAAADLPWWRPLARRRARQAELTALDAAEKARVEWLRAVIDQEEREAEARQIDRDVAEAIERERAEAKAEAAHDEQQRRAGYPALTAWLVEQGLGTPEMEERVALGKEAWQMEVEQAIADADREAAEEQRAREAEQREFDSWWLSQQRARPGREQQAGHDAHRDDDELER